MVVFTAVAVGTLTAFGVSAATIAGMSALTLIAIGVTTQVVLGAALGALMPKPSIGGSNRGYQTTAIGTALDHQIIYGKMRVGGARIYDESTGTNSKYLHRIIAVSGHEIQSFDEIYVNDELITLDGDGEVTSPAKYVNKIRIKLHLGASDQTADTFLISESAHWTTQHRLRGIAYMYIRLAFDADVFPNGIPEITTTISGKKVYNPSNSTTAWSDNPALCLRDYLTSTYGIAEEAANIDDTLVIAAANVCDQTNTDAGTTRYTCNGAFTTASTPYDMINSLLTSMDGSLWYAQGKWRMKPAYWTAPVLDLNEDDLRSSISVSTRHSRRNNFNTVKGTFRGLESNWQTTDYPQVSSATYVAADNGQESVADIDLPFTDNSIEARRIALISLERNRQQLTVNASFGIKTLQVQVGDNIRLTNSRFGWSNKEFEVVSWSFGLTDGLDLQTQMTLRETAESVYDEVDDGIVYERDNTTLLSPFEVPSVGISVVAAVQVSNQKVSNIAVATVTSGQSEAVDHVEVEYKLSSVPVFKMYLGGKYKIKTVGNTDFTLYGSADNNVGTVFIATGFPTDQNESGVVEPFFSSFGEGQLGQFKVVDLEVANYDFRARAVNTFGIKGEFTTVSDVEVNAFIGDPSDVSSLTHEVSGGTLFLSWPPVPDADLSHYEVKHNSNTTGATWGNSTTIIEKIARPGTSTTVPARSGTFLIRAYDKESNFSEGVASAVVLPSELPQLGQTDTQTEDPDFRGDDNANSSNVVVNSTNLEIDDTSSASPSGVYIFEGNIADPNDPPVYSDHIDTGSSRNARITGVRTFTRGYDNGTLLWDNIPQLFDTWPDNFDTWTDENSDFGDVSITVYVSATPDNPASSPTWGSYIPANGAVVVGRAFRFKAILSSTNTNFTPVVSALSATVEY